MRCVILMFLLLAGCQTAAPVVETNEPEEPISITMSADLGNTQFITAFIEGNAADLTFSFDSLQTELTDKQQDALVNLLNRYPDRRLVVFDVNAGKSESYREKRAETLKKFFLEEGRAVIIAPFKSVKNRNAKIWIIGPENEKSWRQDIDYLIVEP